MTIICESFLTDTHDYFCVVETENSTFEIYHIDLDSSDPRIKCIHSYPFSEVGGKKIVNFHCRGSSHKEKINLNQLLVCYMLHGDDLYCWVQGNAQL